MRWRWTGFLTAEQHDDRNRQQRARHHEIALRVLYEAITDYRPEFVGARVVDAMMQAELALGVTRQEHK